MRIFFLHWNFRFDIFYPLDFTRCENGLYASSFKEDYTTNNQSVFRKGGRCHWVGIRRRGGGGWGGMGEGGEGICIAIRIPPFTRRSFARDKLQASNMTTPPSTHTKRVKTMQNNHYLANSGDEETKKKIPIVPEQIVSISSIDCERSFPGLGECMRAVRNP